MPGRFYPDEVVIVDDPREEEEWLGLKAALPQYTDPQWIINQLHGIIRKQARELRELRKENIDLLSRSIKHSGDMSANMVNMLLNKDKFFPETPTEQKECDECHKKKGASREYLIRIPNTDAQVKIQFEHRRMSGSGGCIGIEPSYFCKKCTIQALGMMYDQLGKIMQW
jgi:hypothetical protein